MLDLLASLAIIYTVSTVKDGYIKRTQSTFSSSEPN